MGCVSTQQSEVSNISDRKRAGIEMPRLSWLSHSGARKYWLVAGLSLLVVSLYVGLSVAVTEPGLPLDDGWIHQTYARNLANDGRWSYTSGVVSAGSTAPLWTLLLAIGYFFNLPPLPWTYFWGWLCLTWIGWTGMWLWATLWPRFQGLTWLPGVVLVLSWPLVWAAGSGMETLLFTSLALQLIFLYCRQSKNGEWRIWQLGLLAGLLILTRPDGVALLSLVAAGLLVVSSSPKDKVFRCAIYLFTAALPLIPYFALNLLSSGTIWPNTYYAKQAEYAFLWQMPLFQRLAQLLFFSLGGPAEGWRGVSGAHLLLLPGLLAAVWKSWRSDWKQRRLLYLLPMIWAVGHVFLYAWRLPVTYQHGRYLMPVVPIFILYGLAGWLQLFEVAQNRFHLSDRSTFVLKTFAPLTLVVLLLIFLLLGLQAYSQDVAFINGEMVATARWLEKNTPDDTLIAAHDIGAIGYFTKKPILDLAGLISPQVIPLLANQEGLASYVKESEARYLVTAPGWPYEDITKSSDAEAVYSTNYAWSQAQGINNMMVYKLGG
jgi:hypothetical protein